MAMVAVRGSWSPLPTDGFARVVAVCLLVSCVACGARNPPPEPLGKTPVDPAFSAFWSSALETTISASGSIDEGGLQLGPATMQTTAVLRGPSNRLAFGVIEDGKADGELAHRMQFLLLPPEVIDAARDGRSLCTLRSDAKVRCAEPSRDAEPDDIAVDPDAERLFLLARDRRCVMRKGGAWSCFVRAGSKGWLASTSFTEDLQKHGPAKTPVPDSRCFITEDAKLVCFDEEGISGSVVQTGVVAASVGGGVGDFAAGCAARTDGSVTCWGGSNDTGTAGDGSRGPQSKPSTAKGVRDAIAVARSPDHACALTRKGTVYCWGSADDYAFGEAALERATKFRACDDGEPGGPDCVPNAGFTDQGRNHLVLEPIPVDELSGVVSLAVGVGRTCGVRTDGRILCLGAGHPGPWTIDVGP